MKKVWHPYTKWECYKNGMWKTINGNKRKVLLDRAIEFTNNTDLFGSYMLEVIKLWPITCEHHLSDVNSNRKAWLGQASCSLAIQCPEDITRQAWGLLTQDLQDRSNNKALSAIEIWEGLQNDRKNRDLFKKMADARLSQRNTRKIRPQIRVIEQSSFL